MPLHRRPTALPRRPAGVLATLLLLALLCLLATSGMAIGHRGTGDTGNLVQGARTALDCIHTGELNACGLRPGSTWSAVYPYPALQYGPATALVKAGLDDDGVLRGLAWVSMASFVALLALTVVGARRFAWRGWGPLLVLTMIASPLVYQSTSAFGEMFAATVVLGAVVAALHRRPWLMALGATVAPLGKETLLPFVVVLMVLAARRASDGWLPAARLAAPIAAGGMASLVLSFGFNVFRFGTIGNSLYLKPMFRTPGVGRKAEFTSAIWVAPNGGLAWFWPFATAIVVGTLGVALLRALHRRGRRSWMPPAAAVLVVVGFSVGLGAWWSPFGWISYGNRLMVPIVPAAVLVSVATAEPELTEGVRRLLHRRWVFALAVLAAAVTFPQVRAAWSYRDAIQTLTIQEPECKRSGMIESDPDQYYRCISNTIWRLHPAELRATTTGGGTTGLIAGTLGAATAAALVLAAREADHRRAGAAADPSAEMATWIAAERP